MAMNEEAHGSGARTKEFEFDPASHGVGAVGVPDRADVVITLDSNQTMQADVVTTDHHWRFDVKIEVRGPTCNAEVTQMFVDGSMGDLDELPEWMDPLLVEIESRIEQQVP